MKGSQHVSAEIVSISDEVTLSLADDSLPYKQYTLVATLVGTPQVFTASWADFGAEIDVKGYKKLIVWATLDINDTENARIRILSKHTSAGTEEYYLPIKSEAAGVTTITSSLYYEIGSDADQLVAFDFDVTGYAYIQLQILAGTAGASPGTLAASITKMY
jgi:hypothetical protein